MCYKCDVCGSVVLRKGPPHLIQTLRTLVQPKIVSYRVWDYEKGRDTERFRQDGTTSRTEIEKELKACALCYEGHKQGIPLEQLTKMHRPALLIQPLKPGKVDNAYLSDLQGQGYQPPTIPAAVLGCPIQSEGISPPRYSPKEERTARFLEKEESSCKHKGHKTKRPLKLLIKRGHANHQTKP